MKEDERTNYSREITVSIITKSQELPPMNCRNFFHSTTLFGIVERTPGQQPYMVVALRNGAVVGHLLAVLRRRGSWIPPYLFTQGRVYGEGEYEEGEDKETLFRLLLHAITYKLRRKMCLYIEFSDLSHKMFGYRLFRREGYIPIQWMEIHNSLHSLSPEERISHRRMQHVERGMAAGLVVKTVESDAEFHAFYKTLRRFFSMKVRRYMPPERMFALLSQTGHCKLFVTLHKEKVIGSCACVYSEGNAYLWYMASRRKSYPTLHPGSATVWGAIKDAYAQQCWHIYFMDVGLPFKKNLYREFILSFGGKDVGTYRWFRFTFGWLNKLVGWIYKE